MLRASVHRAGPPRGMGALGRSALHEIRTLAADYALLALVDARSAARRFAWLLSAGLVAAVLAVTAWLALVAGALIWLLGSGVTWSTALAVAALVNLIGAGALAMWMRGAIVAEPPFAATLRQLKGDPAGPAEEER